MHAHVKISNSVRDILQIRPPTERAQVAFGSSFLHTPPYFLYVLAVPRPRLLILPCKLYVFRDSGSPSARSWPTWPPFGSIMAHLAPLWLNHGPLWPPFASLWLDHGPLLLPFGSIMAPFCSPSARSWSTLPPCGSSMAHFCFRLA
jgi:hypothetical protein